MSTTILRAVGSSVLWLLVIAGAASAALWGLNTAGIVQPLVVVSGSMQPEIRTGDLIIATAVSGADLSVGDVATLPSAVTGKLVTHRVIELTRSGTTIEVRMQGDANDVADGETYVIDTADRVWHPVMVIPGAGYVVANTLRPAVAVPLVGGLLALCALSMLPRRARRSAPDAPTPATEMEPHP